MRRLTSGLKPFPTPRVTSVAVGDKELRGVAAIGYLRLFDTGTGVPREYPNEWVPIDVEAARALDAKAERRILPLALAAGVPLAGLLALLVFRKRRFPPSARGKKPPPKPVW